jgi:NAD-dependent SIR2 family protein deacetylase
MVLYRQTTARERIGVVMPRTEPPIDTLVILGAGASAADGAPIQANLFREIFKHCRDKRQRNETHNWDWELAMFFYQFFGIDVDNCVLDRVEFPTFEEILGILEIASSQGESFRNLLGPHLISNGASQLWHIHDVLVFSIAEILHEMLKDSGSNHNQLVKSLQDSGQLERTAFVTFNYDILIDNALLRAVGEQRINYGAEFADQRRHTNSRCVPLYKLHGSLNWLFCSTCRDLQITMGEKSVMRLKWDPDQAICEQCQTPRSPIVIPPTFFKVLSNLHLRMIWDAAERDCLQARRLVFCGYSFPDADIHVRYLLKRVERHRGRIPEVFVVNHHTGKSQGDARWESARYRRFFVNKDTVHYTDVSFEEFAANPYVIEDASRWQ